MNTMQVEIEKTYRVRDARDRSTYTHIKSAPNEKVDTPVEKLNEARYELAVRAKQGWLQNYNPNLDLEIIECDRWGNPLVKPAQLAVPAPKKARRSTRARAQ